MTRRFGLFAATLLAGLPPLMPSAAEAGPRLEKIGHIVFIYGENRSFDHEYGFFPGADGLMGLNPAQYRQTDRDGTTVLGHLPPTWGGVVDSHAVGLPPPFPQIAQIPEGATAVLPAQPFEINDAANGLGLDMNVATRDLYHRFYENQMQIHFTSASGDAKNDQFAAWADGGGLTMGYYHYASPEAEARNEPMFGLAQTFVLADHFFQSAFGGSYLNHHFLICSCTPALTPAQQTRAKQGQGAPGTVTVATTALNTNPADLASSDPKDGSFTFKLALKSAIPSATAASPQTFYQSSVNLTPPIRQNPDGSENPAGLYYTINTMQPPFPPSGNQRKFTAADYDAKTDAQTYSTGTMAGVSTSVDPDQATTVPPQTQTTIGDLLTGAGVDWRWYAGAMNIAIDYGSYAGIIAPGQTKANPTRDARGNLAPNFQAHHNPFNYYANYAPGTPGRAAHLRDGGMDGAAFIADIDAGKLPPVTFYKPQGNLNTHPGYTDITSGDSHIYDIIVNHLMKSSQWNDMVIVVTYDENGGWWDHVPPPRGDMFGPGTRLPAIIVSPFARKGTVDHTQYDTTSILRLITRRFGLPVLPGIARRDAALIVHGNPPMGDLTAALDLD